MLKAWTGEPFEYRGTTVRVTPRPLTQPHPTLLLGGTEKVAARRAARFGLPFFPAAHLPELEAYYYEQCAEHGTEGFCMMPGASTVMTHVAEDPDRAWSRARSVLLPRGVTYSAWQQPGQTSAVHSYAGDVDALRAEGIYEVVSPAELVERLPRRKVPRRPATCTRWSAVCRSTRRGARCASTWRKCCPRCRDRLPGSAPTSPPIACVGRRRVTKNAPTVMNAATSSPALSAWSSESE